MTIFTLDHTPILSIAAVYQSDECKILGIEIENAFKPNLVGNIYAGKVIAIADGMEGAFVDVGLKSNAYIQRKELLRALKITPAKVKDTPLSQLVKKGQMILTQLDKAPYQTKGAQLTNEISLSGEHVVLMPYMKGIKFSRKAMGMTDFDAFEKSLSTSIDKNTGVIIRSSAIQNQIPIETIVDEIKKLGVLWQSILHAFDLTHTIKCLYQMDAFRESTLDMIKVNQIDQFFLDREEDKLWLIEKGIDKKKISVKMPSTALFQEKGIPLDAYINDVHFSSNLGVSITLNELEAFTIVDVNSGKMNMERKTIFQVNDFASKLVLEHILLRNISGIVLVDFVEMTSDEKLSFIQHLIGSGFDKTNGITIHGFTTLGILEITRRREKPSLRDLLSFDFEAADLNHWQMNDLYIELRRIQNHTNATTVSVEVEEAIYVLLRQTQLFGGLNLKVSLKNISSKQKKYRIQTSKD